jgi:hypothetical protein
VGLRQRRADGDPLHLQRVLREDGQPLLDAAGNPRIQAFVVPAALVEIVPRWRSIGLRATASHAYRVPQWVHAEHGFEIDPSRAVAQGPLYRFPFSPFAFVTLAANVAGMAHHFVALAEECIARRRNRFGGNGEPLIEVPAVRALLDATRAGSTTCAAASTRCWMRPGRRWRPARRSSEEEAAQMQALSMEWVNASRRAVDALYPYCGLYAAREDAPSTGSGATSTRPPSTRC